MAKSTEVKKARIRGTGFPVLSLPQAVKIILDASPYGKTHTQAALAAYAGHQTAISGTWRQKEAALRDWGLVNTVSSGTIGLTDRALQIAFPGTPEMAKEALLECFTSTKLYMNIYNELAKGSEINLSLLGNKALTTHGIAIASKDKFINSFVESAAAVGLAERIGADKVKLLPMTKVISEDEAPLQGSETGSQQLATNPIPVLPKRPTVGNPVMHQVWPFDGGEVILSITSVSPFPAKMYGELSKVVETVETLVKTLEVITPGTDNDDSSK